MDTNTLIANLWLLTCTALVFFMQAGFCCLEAGSVRSKNSVNVALKNVVTFLVSGACYYGIGYALMFGSPWIEGWAGFPLPFLIGITPVETFSFLYQIVFCTTAATIVSGAIAERLRFLPYVFSTAGISLLIYPLFGYWAWNGNGWLHEMGYHDFAGSSVVHMIGGFVSLAGIKMVGARIGRFTLEGKPVDIAASNIPMVALGTFILFFGWIGFNGGSSPFGPETAGIVLNTLLGGIFGGLTCLLLGWALHGISGASMIMNGLLAGLVAITACADIVSHQAAAIIGGLGAMAYMLIEKLLLRFGWDDAVGAVPVHAGAGMMGILATGLFAKESYLIEVSSRLGGTFSRLNLIGVQFLGLVTCAVWAYLLGLIMWKITGKLSALRVSESEENIGLNYSEHQVKSPIDEVVRYMVARSAKQISPIRPVSLDDGEYGRIIMAMEKWAVQIEKESRSTEAIKTWLQQDADKIYGIIQKCEVENLLQSQRLEWVVEKIDRIHHELLHKKSNMETSNKSSLAIDVLEIVQDKLTEVKNGDKTLSYYWDQLRNMASSLLKNTKSLHNTQTQTSR